RALHLGLPRFADQLLDRRHSVPRLALSILATIRLRHFSTANCANRKKPKPIRFPKDAEGPSENSGGYPEF
ncbi:MAG: hypothetical protein ACK5LJ_16905, partial [Paracoccus sp. (in: a-proteobacteria)]